MAHRTEDIYLGRTRHCIVSRFTGTNGIKYRLTKPSSKEDLQEVFKLLDRAVTRAGSSINLDIDEEALYTSELEYVATCSGGLVIGAISGDRKELIAGTMILGGHDSEAEFFGIGMTEDRAYVVFIAEKGDPNDYAELIARNAEVIDIDEECCEAFRGLGSVSLYEGRHGAQ